MARNDSLPKNVAIRENPLRFNPNDKNQLHGGFHFPTLDIEDIEIVLRHHCISRKRWSGLWNPEQTSLSTVQT